MKLIKIVMLSFFTVCLTATVAVSDEQLVNVLKARIEDGEKLTLAQCIELAIENNPNIQAAINTTQIYEGKIGQAKSDYLPQINLSSGYNRRNSITSSSIDNSSNSYSSSISLNQMIYDFGKTSSQLKIHKFGLEGASADIDNIINEIVYSVKESYYNVLYALQNKKVYGESVEQYEKQFEQAKGFYEEGLKPKIEVTTAEVNLSNAKFNYIKADNALKTAYVDLNNAIGIPDALSYDLADDLGIEEYDITLNEALEEAYDNRPDLKAMVLKENVAEESVKLAKKDYFPTLQAVTSYGLGGSDFPLDDGWSVGGEIKLPVFNGLLTHNKIKEAKANLEVTKSNEEILKLNIFQEVQKAHIAFAEAKKRIPVAEMTVEQAKENYRLASERYEVGIGNPIEVKDAEVSYSNAKLDYYQTLYDYNVAKSNLERVIGSK